MSDSRFAPSPSGPLHLGHAYSAVIAQNLAERSGGQLRLRIDDIDGTRSRAEFVDGAIADLAWLGIEWAPPLWRQSEHLDRYAAALDRLIAAELAYPCFCTRADVAGSVTAPHGPSGAIYPGTCRNLTKGQRAERMASAPWCWRIDMTRATESVGPLNAVNSGALTHFDARSHGDVVIARKDAPASYHLASTIDDAVMGIGLVVRGTDLLPATAVHVLLQKLLGLPTPAYHHHALVVGVDGQRLAKRDRPATLAAFRVAGADGKELAKALRVHQLPAGYSLAKA
ncbi:MAG: tRNA glutamyl-Q(34) synthetase GluQRS [Sphingopyxis sp.]|nr:tRNA glutamyl-Q(34) synthetase GluQRS [Sphingopyxis sp.]